MRFALFCDDPQAEPLARVLSPGTSGHQWLYWVRTLNSPLHERIDEPLGPRVLESWETLLTATDIDGVIVGGSEGWIQDGIKQIATAGIPILLLARAGQGSTSIYELGLIYDEKQAPIIPVFWHRHDAAANRLRQAIANGELGRIQFLQCDRGVAQNSTNTPIPQSQVDEELLADLDLLRWLIGDYDHVTALRTAVSEAGILRQNVVLSNPSLPDANWTISPTNVEEEWRLIVRGEQHSAALIRDANSPVWTCVIRDETTRGDLTQTSNSVLNSFESAVTSGSSKPEWPDLVKCFETVDATHRSVRRKRTVELFFEPMSERAIFKTQMTAIGCGLLVGTLFLMLCFLGIASIVPLPKPVLIGMRYLVFLPLVVFLLAQILLPLTRPSSMERGK